MDSTAYCFPTKSDALNGKSKCLVCVNFNVNITIPEVFNPLSDLSQLHAHVNSDQQNDNGEDYGGSLFDDISLLPSIPINTYSTRLRRKHREPRQISKYLEMVTMHYIFLYTS